MGKWSRVEGTPCDPNPNKPFAKMDNPPLFNMDGRLNPSITIIGKMALSMNLLCLFWILSNYLVDLQVVV